jgi:hypothetical protein
MTISTTEPRILYTGNGSTTSYSVPFDFDADGDLKVDLITTATGAVTAQTLTTDYTISTTNVVFVTAPPATQQILITLDVDMDQDTNYVANDPFPAETHEDALDERVKQIKQLKHVIDYNIPKLPSNVLTTSTVTDTNILANYVFSINSTADGIELQEATSILDITGLTNETPVIADSVIFSDASDSDNPKYATMQQLKNLMDTSSSAAIIEVDGSVVSAGTPTLDFDGTDFSLTESPTDSFDITIQAERIQDIAGAMWTGNTETGATVTYQDADGTIDITVSDTTVAGDSGSTGITPGDTLTIAGGTGITTAMSGDTLTITNDVTDTDTFTTVEVDGVAQSTNAPTLDFDGTDFTLTESPTDSFDITISSERIQDIVGAMVTANTETGIAVTYQDADGTVDFIVSDTTVAGDSGSTGITPGDTLTIAGGTNITTAMSGDTLTVNNDYTDESIQDLVGAMVETTNTETGITVTYQDATGDIDFVVSDTTVAGDSGSTGITPGDTLTIAGGTNATTAMSGDTLTVNVDDAFISNTGDTGTGVYDFGGATSFEIPNGAAPTVDAAGEIAIDTTITDYTGLIKYHDGTEELTVVALPTANLTTTDNHVVVYDAAGNEFKMEAQSGAGGGGIDEGKAIALQLILK